MKKTISIILTFVIALVITLVVAHFAGWYRFGDEITKQVIVRLIGFFFIIEGLALSIYTFILTKKETPTK